MTIDYSRVSSLYADKWRDIQCDEFSRLNQSVENIWDRTDTFPFDWRYNAVYWICDVTDLCEQIRHSIAWMQAYAAHFSESQDSPQWSGGRLVSYYADNALIRISACRDKLALSAWSYYCPFNPMTKDKVLAYEQVSERLVTPLKFGLKLSGHEKFLEELNKLRCDSFDKAIGYRHKKIHRMEPKVLVDGDASNNAPPYLFAMMSEKHIKTFDERPQQQHQDDRMRAKVRENCFIDGVLFDRRYPSELGWDYADCNRVVVECWKRLCEAAAGVCDILLDREPLASMSDGPPGGSANTLGRE